MKRFFFVLIAMTTFSCAAMPSASMNTIETLDQKRIFEHIGQDVSDGLKKLYPPAHTNIFFSSSNFSIELNERIVNSLRESGYAVSEKNTQIAGKNNLRIKDVILDEIQKNNANSVYRLSLYMEKGVLSRLYLYSKDGTIAAYGEWSLQE